jgi:hypothetical protein
LKSTGIVIRSDLWETFIHAEEAFPTGGQMVEPNPVIAVCAACSTQFKVPLTELTKTKDAQAYIQEEFERHKCKQEDASQAAARIVNELLRITTI